MRNDSQGGSLSYPGKRSLRLAPEEQRHNQHFLWRVGHDTVCDVKSAEEYSSRGFDIVTELGMVAGAQKL